MQWEKMGGGGGGRTRRRGVEIGCKAVTSEVSLPSGKFHFDNGQETQAALSSGERAPVVI